MYICRFAVDYYRDWDDLEISKTSLKTGATNSVTVENGISDGKMVFFKGNLHFFSLRKHSIFDKKSQKLVILHRHHNDLRAQSYDLTYRAFIALETKNMMIIFGGIMNKPFIYKSVTNEWIQSDMIFKHGQYDLISFGHVVTMDEKYVITFGGRFSRDPYGKRKRNYESINDIYIIDVDKMTLKKSKICLPEKSANCRGIIMKDEMRDTLIVFGCVRNCWKDNSMSEVRMLPDYLIRLILSHYRCEYLHFMTRSSHCKIDVDYILNNLI